jgi:hypothetical protein
MPCGAFGKQGMIVSRQNEDSPLAMASNANLFSKYSNLDGWGKVLLAFLCCRVITWSKITLSLASRYSVQLSLLDGWMQVGRVGCKVVCESLLVHRLRGIIKVNVFF